MAMISKSLVITLLLLFIKFIFPLSVGAQTILFQDNFNNGNANGWGVPRNTCSSNWQMNSFTYGIVISNSCVTESIPTALAIPATSPYGFEVDMAMASDANMDRDFVFKYQSPSNWYGIHTIGNSVYVQKVVSGTELFLTNRLSSFPFLANQTYHFKIEVFPSQIKVYPIEQVCFGS